MAHQVRQHAFQVKLANVRGEHVGDLQHSAFRGGLQNIAVVTPGEARSGSEPRLCSSQMISVSGCVHS
jgi:hypothetical protein